MPGYGQSPAPQEWTIGAVVTEIVKAVKLTTAQRVTLIGNCGGALFALLAAQKLSPLIARVVMIDPFAYMPRYFKLFVSDSIGQHAYNATFANPVGRWLTNQTLRGRRAGASDLTASFAAADHEVARRYLSLFAAMGRVEQFRGFNAPVEIAHGAKTFAAVKRSLAQWRAVLPDARIHELQGAGHLPIEEATAQVAAIIFDEQHDDAA